MKTKRMVFSSLVMSYSTRNSNLSVLPKSMTMLLTCINLVRIASWKGVILQ